MNIIKEILNIIIILVILMKLFLRIFFNKAKKDLDGKIGNMSKIKIIKILHSSMIMNKLENPYVKS
jgi:hypothetical protein